MCSVRRSSLEVQVLLFIFIEKWLFSGVKNDNKQNYFRNKITIFVRQREEVRKFSSNFAFFPFYCSSWKWGSNDLEMVVFRTANHGERLVFVYQRLLWERGVSPVLLWLYFLLLCPDGPRSSILNLRKIDSFACNWLGCFISHFLFKTGNMVLAKCSHGSR